MSQKCYENSKQTFDGLLIYLLPRKSTQNNEYRAFLQEILIITLYLNERLHLFGKSILSTVFIFSKIQEKPLHIFTAVANALFYYGMQLIFFAPSQKTKLIQSTCLQYG